MGKTAINWTDYVWNPLTGCTPVSEGCRNCYARELHDNIRRPALLRGAKMPEQYAQPFDQIQLFHDRLEDPLRWRKPRRVFVNSMGDLFHPDVPFDFISDVFAAMAVCQQHTFIVLTKRPDRMKRYFTEGADGMGPFHTYIGKAVAKLGDRSNTKYGSTIWPMKNVILGVSIEDQATADQRIPILLDTPAACRVVSAEPLLGPVDFRKVPGFNRVGMDLSRLWVIVGGETGRKARPMHPDWVRLIRDLCQNAKVPFFFKSWGEWMQSDETADKAYKKCQTKPDWRILNLAGGHGFHGDRVIAVHRVGHRRSGCQLDGETYHQRPEMGA